MASEKEDLLGLRTTETFSTIKPIKLGEEDVIGEKVVSRENRLDDQADATPFFNAVGAAFSSGDNFGYQIYKRMERESITPAPDPNYKPDDFIARNRKVIPGHLEAQFRMATSETEANLILSDLTTELQQQDMLERRGGFSTFAARAIAGIVDIDTPIAIMTGGLSAMFKGGLTATKWGRVATGAGAGGLTQAAGAGLAFEAGTTQDWTSIPAAGLGGLAFGALGGALAKAPGAVKSPEELANEAVRKTLHEFDETLTEGMPLAARDIRREVHTDTDPYGSRARAEAAVSVEANTKADPTVRNESLRTELKTLDDTDRDVGFEVSRGPVRTALEWATNSENFYKGQADEHIKVALDAGRKDIATALVEKAEKQAADTKAKLQDPAPDAPNAEAIKKSNAAAIEAAETEAKRLKELLDAELAKPQAFDLSSLNIRPDNTGDTYSPGQIDRGSVGARQLNPQGSVASITNSRSAALVSAARRRDQLTGFSGMYFDKFSALRAKGDAGDFVARAAMRFHDVIVASPLVKDFDRLMRTGSIVAQGLAHDIFENAASIVRNNRSAAALKDHYEKRLLGSFLPAYADAYAMWTRQQGMNYLDRITSSKKLAEFDELVAIELNTRAFDPSPAQRSLDRTPVQIAADAHDRWSRLDIEIATGRPGEGTVKGYENVTAYSGYMPQKWGNKKIEQVIRAGHSEKAIIAAISEGYRNTHRFMLKDDADKYAAAVVRRARSNDIGADSNLIGILQGDGRAFLEADLRAQGLQQSAIDKMIDRFTGAIAERGQAGHTKGRVDMDMRFTATNGIRMLDLFDIDLVRTVSRRSRGTSGAAALARKGITSRADRNDVIEAILHEQQARQQSMPTGSRIDDMLDGDKHVTRQELEELFSYFDSGPVAGGVGAGYSSIKKLTNLALLNQLGLTQMGELGAQIAAVGVGRWWDHAGAALKKSASDPKSELVKELRHMDILVPEERLFRDDLNLEADRMGDATSYLAQRAQTLLDKGQRIQGYTSGYYAVRNFQQRVAVSSAADKIMTNMKGLATDLSAARAEDMGLDPKTWARIKKYVDDGTVEFKDGSLHKLNFDKWDPDIVEDFALSLNRQVNMVVQKAMIGESNILFHRDGLAALFFHLKSFPLLALEKQLMRHVKHSDGEAMSTFLAGLATAAVAFSARQAINGREENLTAEKIARGAIGYSNMTGWLPMWSDPVMSMLGFDSLKFNTYNQGIDGNVLSTPAALTTLNRMANIPGAVINGLSPFHDMSNNDIRSLQATPLIGNAYGFSAILNAMKSTPAERRAAKKAQGMTDAEVDSAEEPSKLEGVFGEAFSTRE